MHWSILFVILFVQGIGKEFIMPLLAWIQAIAIHVQQAIPVFEAAWRRIHLRAVDRALRDIKRLVSNTYVLYVGTHVAMYDNLVAQMISVGISVEEIVHSIFSCRESWTSLRQLLQPLNLEQPLNEKIMGVLFLGEPVHHHLFAHALLYSDNSININITKADQKLDLSVYEAVAIFPLEMGFKTAYKHLDGAFQIVGHAITCAVVPYDQGVKYYRLKRNSRFYAPTMCDPGKGAHIFIETVDTLVGLRCDVVLAWSLVTSVALLDLELADVCSTVIESFKIVSSFRTRLHIAIGNCVRVPLQKRLFGNKKELLSAQLCTDTSFLLERSVYEAALRESATSLLEDSALEPFTLKFLSLNSLKTHMTLLRNLIDMAKTSDVNEGHIKQQRSRFNGREAAVLGALNGNEVLAISVSEHTDPQFFYQDDMETKCLWTPFCKLMVFAANNCRDLENNQVQQLHSTKGSLKNWIALRAAFEFDFNKGQFGYDTDSFRHATELIDKSVLDFISDTTHRFSNAFDEAPQTIKVSYLTALCKSIAEKSGASSAWLVREMVARYIAHGARVQQRGGANDTYGCMEVTTKQAICNLPVSDKVLLFDMKVDLEGVRCRLSELGKVELCQRVTYYDYTPNRIFLRFDRCAWDLASARERLKGARIEKIEVLSTADCDKNVFDRWLGDFETIDKNACV